MELVLGCEEEFGFEILDEDPERMKNSKDVIEYLERRLRTRMDKVP